MKPDLMKHKAIKIKPYQRWLDVHSARTGLTLKAKDLMSINRYVNDLVAYKIENKDLWQTPDETLKLKTGDCEDYVILKRALLFNAGFKEENMYLLVVKDLIARLNHALLAVREKGIIYILDNQNNLVLREDEVVDYVPLFAFSGPNGWVYAK